MASSRDPEKYSLDEMMERLRAKPPEESPDKGELVVRSDGSTAIRVRKRKRRSTQPKKEETKRKRRALVFQVSGFLILLLLFSLAAGGALVYANSIPFRDSLIQKLRSGSGAEVSLQQFRMNPANAHATAVTLTWPDQGALQSLTARNLKAEIFPSSFLGKSFKGEEITAAEGELVVRSPGTGQAGQPATSYGTLVDFNRFGVGRLTVHFGDPATPMARITGTEASFYPKGVNGHPQLRLNRGEWEAAGWPALRMDRAFLEFRENSMEVVNLRLTHEADRRGILELAGTVRPLERETPSTLEVKADGFPLAGILGPNLGSLISGRIDTEPEAASNTLSFIPSADTSGNLVLSFRGSLDAPIELKHFPFLLSLAKALQDDWFEHPIFSGDATGTIRRGAGVVRLVDLSLVGRPRMALRGSIAMDRGNLLSGILEIGLTHEMIVDSTNPKIDAMFSEPRDGFRWAKITIGGTAESPTDDFSEQYAATVSAPAPAASGSGSRTPTFEELTKPR